MSKINYMASELPAMTPAEFRHIVRRGGWKERTELVACSGYAQANLAIVPKEYAFDFLLFCHRNPRPCPLLDVTEPGDPHPKLMAPDADLRTDLPKYRVYQDGQLIDEPTDITKYWQNDFVAFLIGCSGSIDWALQAAAINYRITGVYMTNIQCIPAGRFHGPMTVTGRIIKGSHDAIRTIQVSSRYPLMHGTPIHIGTPALLGIKDVCKPMLSPEPIAPIEPDEIPMFWGCGVTAQMVALESKPPIMITHCPAHMFVTDRLTEELAVI